MDKKAPLTLMIEDDDGVRTAISAYLEDRGFRVVEAADGHIGMDIFRNENPDVVLVDLRMPGLDGLDVVSTITSESPDTPTIVVSATGDISDAIEALHRGAWDYVIKPIEDMGILYHAIEQVLERTVLIQEKRNYQEQLEVKIRQTIEVCEKAELQRAKLQEQLFQAQKMETIGLLASGVVHDFNNLLTVISGHATLARHALAHKSVTPEALKNVLLSLETVEYAVEQATGVTHTLMNFSQKQPIVMNPVDLRASIEKAIRMLQRTLPASIRFIVDIECEPAPWVLADPTQLQQIILNLAINARDAMPKGGKLYISISPPMTGMEQSNQPIESTRLFTQLQVSDTGTGMTPVTQTHIFEPFFTTKTSGQGTGLGLSITHGIVEAYDGVIKVQSEVGAGTTFTIILPCVPPESNQTKYVPGDVKKAKNDELILVAISDRQCRAILASALESTGHAIVLAEDGNGVLNYFEQYYHDIKLIILDMCLPNQNGLECLCAIHEKGAKIPAILITQNADDRPDNHVDDDVVYLTKPFQIPELIELVQYKLDKYRSAGVEA